VLERGKQRGNARKKRGPKHLEGNRCPESSRYRRAWKKREKVASFPYFSPGLIFGNNIKVPSMLSDMETTLSLTDGYQVSKHR
jgi:hypothetical protein